MVIILIGVLSAISIGLFTKSSAFSPLLATQQLQSATLLAQQAALAGNSTRDKFSLSREGDEFLFKVGNETVAVLPHKGAQFGLFGMSKSDLPISFDKLGRPAINDTVRFEFSGDSTFNICLSTLGAVYREGCE